MQSFCFEGIDALSSKTPFLFFRAALPALLTKNSGLKQEVEIAKANGGLICEFEELPWLNLAYDEGI
jgi:hypothetical protein